MLRLIPKIISQLKKTKDLWPMPYYDEKDQPHFLFIITPPHSGSTVLAKILNTSDKTAGLSDNLEGQWLIPGLCAQDRWDSRKVVNYDSVKAVWLSKYQQIKQAKNTIDVIIEKSPPNMIRIMTLAAQFKSYSFIANNRNPYAFCSSHFHRRWGVDNNTERKKRQLLSYTAENWINRSGLIQSLVKAHNIPLITYEEFCQNPNLALSKLKLPNRVFNTINTGIKVKIKDYPTQKIINQNERQILKLTDEDIRFLSNIFAKYKDLLAYFGYALL